MVAQQNTNSKKDKLKELILGILNETKRPVSKVKLAKLVFFTEIEYFKKYKRSITDLYFVRLDYGPVISFFEQTLRDGEGKEWEKKKEPIYIKEIDQKKVTHNYIAKEQKTSLDDDVSRIIKRTVARYGNMSGTKLSQLTHQLPAWKYSEPNEPIYLAELTKTKEEEYFALRDAVENIDDTSEMEKNISRLLSRMPKKT